MNVQMAYLLGMIVGNGEISRDNFNTTISISIPHKIQYTFDKKNIPIYVKASITDIRSILEPVIGSQMQQIQNKSQTNLYFSKPNSDYLVTEIIKLCGNERSCTTMRIPQYFFDEASFDEIKSFLRGIADVTGYIRNSNCAFYKNDQHRVYIEIPQNWYLVVDICNLLKKIDVPVQSIDWGHPNMRDPKLGDYKKGKISVWKREHQIKIFANEFVKIGFNVIHKNEGLMEYARRLENTFCKLHPGHSVLEKTHRYYWEITGRKKIKPIHPCENDESIPLEIRGKHYNNWREIAYDLGYKK